MEPKNAAKVDSLRDKSIKESIDAKLEQKGLIKTDTDSADLLVAHQAGVGTEKQHRLGLRSWLVSWRVVRPDGSYPMDQTSTIYTGQLVLDMYDSKNHDLVWRGVVSKTIDPEAKTEKQEKNLNKAVTKLLKNYPPPVKQ